MTIRVPATLRARTVACATPGRPLGAAASLPELRSLRERVHLITRPRTLLHARDSISPQLQTVERRLAADDGAVTQHARPFDVFLCHSGRTDGDVPLLLDHVSTALQQLPSIEGGAVKCVFWHGEDVDGLGAMVVHAQNLWQAAIRLIPIGAHGGSRCR